MVQNIFLVSPISLAIALVPTICSLAFQNAKYRYLFYRRHQCDLYTCKYRNS